jgi:hypothetical protein
LEKTARIPIDLPAEISAAYQAMIKSLWRYGRLTPHLREMVRLRSAVLANCVV